jgi:hypothetical protein
LFGVLLAGSSAAARRFGEEIDEFQMSAAWRVHPNLVTSCVITSGNCTNPPVYYL